MIKQRIYVYLLVLMISSWCIMINARAVQNNSNEKPPTRKEREAVGGDGEDTTGLKESLAQQALSALNDSNSLGTDQLKLSRIKDFRSFNVGNESVYKFTLFVSINDTDVIYLTR